jgi:hypothetical protein
LEPSTVAKHGVGIGILLLGAAQGGVVNNRNIAVRLAELLFGSFLGSSELQGNIAFQIVDAGDWWSVRGSLAGPARHMSTLCEFRIVKSDATVIDEHGGAPRDLLGDAAIAEKFAAALLENAAGAAELQRQRPLVVEDRGETWRIRGGANADRAVEGPGPFALEVQKRDARVLDIKFEWVLETPPDLREMLRGGEAARRRPRG